MKPRARERGLLVEEVGGETLVYDLDRHKAHCLGPVLAEVWRLCDGRSTPAEIARRLRRRSGAAVDQDVVAAAVRRLARARLLEEPLAVAARVSLRGRRELLKKAALLGGLSLASITAPTASSAATCITLGDCRALGNKQCTGTPCCSPGAPTGSRCTKQTQGSQCNCNV